MKLPISGLMLVVVQSVCAQPTRTLTLDQVIQLAQTQSPSSQITETMREISQYEFSIYRSDLKPQLSLYGNAPVYNKEYFGVRQPDGTVTYQAISQNSSNLGVSVSQKIAATGGELSLNTSLSRFDDFKLNTKQYNGTPVFLMLSQPLFGVNDLRWQKLIAPLKLEEARRAFYQEMENIAQQTANLFFDVLIAQNDIEISEVNLRHTLENFETEKQRVDLGTTTEDKLLQLELQQLRSKQALDKARYDQQIAQYNLKAFMGDSSMDFLNLIRPEQIPAIEVDVSKAIFFARNNRSEFVSFARKVYEAQREVAYAKATKQQVNLIASYGLNNIGENLAQVYQNPNNQQRFSIGFSIPIVDWGRRKARYNTAKATEKLIVDNNRLDEINISQQVTTLVKNVELLQSNINMARKADSVAERRYVIANTLYQAGKLTATDLIIAQGEKDAAKQDYVLSLKSFWDVYFLIRKLTLHDFVKGADILAESNNRIP